MKKVELLICLAALSLATQVAAQQPATRSILKQADHVQWADHYGSVGHGGDCGCGARVGCGCSGGGQIGCSTGICHGYDNCCPPRPLLCALKRVGRMLDCLLPCNKCCHGGCLFGGCRPHLFHRGSCHGSMSCNTGCPSCSTPVGSMPMSDPFIDDPMPPKPMPDPAKDVRRPVSNSPYALRVRSPYKVTTASDSARQRKMERPLERPQTPQASINDKFASRTAPEQPTSRRLPAQDVTPATAELETPEPALLPVTIRRTSAEFDAEEMEIPVNPLRQ